jgi:predicted GIY-YIG superfamily endonuclease
MPRTPINYENTIFYKIVCKDLNLNYCYVGHTTDFRRRKTEHKSSCINENDKDYNYKIISNYKSKWWMG